MFFAVHTLRPFTVAPHAPTHAHEAGANDGIRFFLANVFVHASRSPVQITPIDVALARLMSALFVFRLASDISREAGRVPQQQRQQPTKGWQGTGDSHQPNVGARREVPTGRAAGSNRADESARADAQAQQRTGSEARKSAALQTMGFSHLPTYDELKAKFKELALKLHPDKNTDDPAAAEKFDAMKQSFDFLKDLIQNSRAA